MDSSVDLNTSFANVERTFALAARRFQAKADEAMANMEKPENFGIKEGLRQEAERAMAQVELWEARRRTAANGYFLARQVDLNDPGYMSEYGDLCGLASAAGRVVYAEDVEGDDLERDLSN